MYRIVLTLSAVGVMVAGGAGTASAQVPVVQTFPQTTTPLYTPPVVTTYGAATVVTPGIPLTGYAAPAVVVAPPVLTVGYPWYYGRSYYYPHYYHRHW